MTGEGLDRTAIEAILDQRVAERRAVGLVVATMDAGGKVETFAAGHSGREQVPLDGATVFEIGSITKTFTAALLAQMVAAGELGLDDPVRDHLPASVRIPDRGGRQITLLDLATHTSGLPRLPSNLRPATMANPYADYTVDLLYEFLASHVLERDIGAQYEYSNVGGGLLGHVLSLRGRSDYESLVIDRILRPLGMNETRITLAADLAGRFAAGHDDIGHEAGPWDFEVLAGTGAFRSTVDDMVKYLAANLEAPLGPLGPILAATHQPRRPAAGDQTAIGLAWHRLRVPAGTLIWHNGGTGGFRSIVGFDPARKVGIVLLGNSAIDPDDIAVHLLDPSQPLARAPIERHEVPVPLEVLEPCVGVYQLDPAVFPLVLTVSLEGGSLMIQAGEQPRIRLCPESETAFFIREGDYQVTFAKDMAGQVTGLVLFQSGQGTEVPRVS